MTIRVGVIGTSWWTDSMYLPALDGHPQVEVVAVCGRNADRAAALADQWKIESSFVDPTEMLDTANLDAVVIATPNNTHHEMAGICLDRGLHVLCEKPLALSVEEAEDLAARAERAQVKTMVPFTYRYMPMVRWLKRLIDEGYVGNVRHMNLRYYTGFANDGEYVWRFDQEFAGSGVIGDLASHWIYVARWLIGQQETGVSGFTSNMVDRAERPDGSDYEQTEDGAALTVTYDSGAYSLIQVSAVAWEPGDFGQSHQIEIHGDAGTLHAISDWQTIQQVTGSKWGSAGPHQVLPIPDDLWDGAPRQAVHDTYRHTFRKTSAMTRAWIDAIAADQPSEPGFDEGLAVQRVIDAAVQSAKDASRMQPIEPSELDPRS